MGIVATMGGFVLACELAGCGSISTNRADCNAVRLQTEAGRSDAEIASALGVPESDVTDCRAMKSGAPGTLAPSSQ